ncbi:MAG: hypothetical protein QXR17_05460 [Candidatus Bathyarchaeia archaeon]
MVVAWLIMLKNVETLGIRIVREAILRFTSFLRVISCPYVGIVGAKLLKKTWSGDKFMAFNLNIARAFLGKNVNIYLKDGSVIINVKLTDLESCDSEGKASIKCTPYGEDKVFTVPLRKIAWVKPVDLSLIQTLGGCG